MESLQNLFAPSLKELLDKIEHSSTSGANKKQSRKKVMSNKDSSQRKKRNRITFDSRQVEEMEKVFAENQYPDATSRDELASRIQLHEERVQIWFQNRRAKFRRELRHTYHPYEPPKEEEYPYLKKKSASPETTKTATVVAEVKLLAPLDTADLLATSRISTPETINSKNSSPSSVVIPNETANLTAAQLAASLSFLMKGAQSFSEKEPPILADNTETTVVTDNDLEASDQLNSEKAILLIWALSSLFNVQTEVAQS